MHFHHLMMTPNWKRRISNFHRNKWFQYFKTENFIVFCKAVFFKTYIYVSLQEVHEILKEYELKYCFVDRNKGTGMNYNWQDTKTQLFPNACESEAWLIISRLVLLGLWFTIIISCYSQILTLCLLHINYITTKVLHDSFWRVSLNVWQDWKLHTDKSLKVRVYI